MPGGGHAPEGRDVESEVRAARNQPLFLIEADIPNLATANAVLRRPATNCSYTCPAVTAKGPAIEKTEKF